MMTSLILWMLPLWTGEPQTPLSLELEKRPTGPPRNVIVVLIDDLRADALSCTGHPFIQTPNIDRLATEGANFTRAFVTTALCSPSRASILSGQYMHRHKVIDNNVPGTPGTVWYPQYLQKAGYQTAFVGKWHMGGGSDDPKPGFDHWVSFRGQGFYLAPGPVWSLNVDGQRVPQKGYITDELTDYALAWLEKTDRSKPFFLHLAHKAVHAPFRAADRHRGRYAKQEINLPKLASDWDARPGVPMWVKNQRNSWHGVEFPYHSNLDLESFYREYAETVLAIDDSVGRILDWLDKSGHADDTAVMFLSDNGFLWGEHGLIDKRCSYEESMRVPFLVRAPGLAPKGQKVDRLIANIDIAPTVLELAGLVPPKEMDGRSFVPLLSAGANEAPWRDEILYEYYWEWNFPHTPTQFALRTPRYKLIEYHGIWDTDEFFDLEADPAEQKNLIREREHLPTVKKMRERLHELLRETDGVTMPLGSKQGPGQNRRNKDGSGSAEFPPYLEDAPRKAPAE